MTTAMPESERNRVAREIDRLVAAETDMKDAADAADALATHDYPICPPVLTTGLVVTYMRPYTFNSKRRRVPAELFPTGDDVELHDSLEARRNDYFAHTGESNQRKAVDPFGEHSYVEMRPVGLKSEVLPRIADLARRQAERFADARHALEQELRDAGVPADATI